jgi:hypothetical protein
MAGAPFRLAVLAGMQGSARRPFSTAVKPVRPTSRWLRNFRDPGFDLRTLRARLLTISLGSRAIETPAIGRLGFRESCA